MRVALLLLVCFGTIYGQSFDDFGGLTSVGGPGHPNTQSATCSQSGSVQTCTVTDATKFAVNEPMLISGTSTGMDWVFDGTDPNAGASIISGISANTLTLTAHVSTTVASTPGKIRPGRWYTSTVGGWMRLFDPEDHWMFLESMGHADLADVSTKYGGNNCTAAAAELAQFKSWGFNLVSNTPTFYYNPDSDGNCPSNAKTPYFYEGFLSQYGSANLNGYLDQPIKNMDYGMDTNYGCSLRRPSLDYFDNRWYTFVVDALSASSSLPYFKSPFIVGWAGDDIGSVQLMGTGSNFHYAGGTSNDCDAALGVLVTSPHQTYNPIAIYGNSNPYIYSDSTVYTKVAATAPPASCSVTTPCTLRDYLAKKYGTITALNAAWGSTYTTFDSTETVITGESVGTGDGSTLSFSHTLHTNVTPFSIQILVNGSPIGGDCPAFAYVAYSGSACAGIAGMGTIAGTTASGLTGGSITYSSGVATITFSAGHAPSNGATITVNYTWGGWDAGGTGLMDEDGRGSWIGTNYVCLVALPSWQANHAYSINDEIQDATSGTWQIAATAGTSGASLPTFSTTRGNSTSDGSVTWHSIGTPVCGTGGDHPAPNANQTLAADIEDWRAEFTAQYVGQQRAGLEQAAPDMLDWGEDDLGPMDSVATYKGYQPYIDVGYVTMLDPTLEAQATDEFRVMTQYFQKPIFAWTSMASAQTSTGCGTFPVYPSGPYCFSTNVERGQHWYDMMSWFTTVLGYDGLKHFNGAQWWGSHDFQSVGWGLKSNLDNAFDGHEDVTASVSCSAPNASLTCGGESAGSGFLGTDAINGANGIAAGNALWYSSIIIPGPASVLSGVTLSGLSSIQ